METITLHIDGREIRAASGQTVLEAALAANIYIPHLCTHPDLPIQGNCNRCVVEISDRSQVVISRRCQSATSEAVPRSRPAINHNHKRPICRSFL